MHKNQFLLLKKWQKYPQLPSSSAGCNICLLSLESLKLQINPLVPDSERQDEPVSLPIHQLEVDLKLKMRIIFCTLGINGLQKHLFRQWRVKFSSLHTVQFYEFCGPNSSRIFFPMLIKNGQSNNNNPNYS